LNFELVGRVGLGGLGGLLGLGGGVGYKLAPAEGALL